MSAYRPYPKYKPSGVEWLGDVPEGWVVTRLGYVCKFTPGKAHESFIDYDGEFVCVNSRFVSTEGKSRKFCTANLSPAKESDILMVMSDLPNGRALAKAYFVGDEKNLAVNQRVCILTAIGNNPRFLYYYLDRNQSFLQFDDGVSQTHLSNASFTKLSLPLPPLPEQHQIAAFLDRECGKLDALQAKQERLIELLKEKRQALISHAVTKGLDPTAKLKPSGVEWLGEVPEHWEEGRIKTVSRFTTSGPRGWAERVGETGALFVQSGDLNDRLEIEFASTRRVDVEGNAETSRTRLRDGDVVVCITGAKTGNVAVCDKVPEEAYINQHLCLIRPNRKVASRFVGTVLKSHLGRSYFDVSQYGLKQGLSLEDVLEAPMPLPPLAEQRAIVAHLDEKCGKIDQLKAKAERGIELLKERRSALISAAVTGKIDVRHT